MSSSANAQHEPTMEEILASIRKIISEDTPDGAKPAPAPMPEPVAAEPSPFRSAMEEAPQGDTDVLELTDEVPGEAPFAPVFTPLPENDIAFENDEPEPEPEADPEPEPADDLISDSTRSAVGRAFAGLGLEPRSQAPAGGGGNTLDALFLRAINDAFTPVLQDWVEDHYDEILERMKPMIRKWMDDNLPALVESVVTKEIRAAATVAPRPRRR